MHHFLFTGRFVSAEPIAEDWGTLKVESLQILLKLWLKAPCFGGRWGAWGGTAGGAALSSPPGALLMFPGPSGNHGGACVLFDSASVMFRTTQVPLLSAGNSWGKSFESKAGSLWWLYFHRHCLYSLFLFHVHSVKLIIHDATKIQITWLALILPLGVVSSCMSHKNKPQLFGYYSHYNIFTSSLPVFTPEKVTVYVGCLKDWRR